MVKPRIEWRSTVFVLNLDVHFSRMLFMKHQKHAPVISGSPDYTTFECCLSACILTAGINKADALFVSAEIIYIHKRWEPEPETDRAAGSPVQSVERMGFVVVSPLVVTHVDGDRRMESREDVMRACKRKTERERVEKKPRLSKKKFQRQQRYNKVTWISERAEQFRVKYWHYHTRVEE